MKVKNNTDCTMSINDLTHEEYYTILNAVRMYENHTANRTGNNPFNKAESERAGVLESELTSGWQRIHD